MSLDWRVQNSLEDKYQEFIENGGVINEGETLELAMMAEDACWRLHGKTRSEIAQKLHDTNNS